MIEIKLAQEKEKCCGCGTCMLVCPTKAIVMQAGELGCLYPKIDGNKCIQCYACENACAYTKETPKKKADPKVFAAAAKDREMLKRSASGGVFASVAHSIIDAGGIVYGCSLEMMNGVLTPMHIGVETHEGIEKLQGSKYVQSSLGTVFAGIKEHLKQGRIVLFSGTPCQADALRHYLKDIDISRLYVMDLICHGVPSAELFEGYLKELSKKNKGRVSVFHFRDKRDGWGLNASYGISCGDGMTQIRQLPTGLSSYYSLFLQSETYRESCYSCKYANTNRVGDITIGDFWGIEQEYPKLLVENGGKLSAQKGISAVLVNTPKGHQMLERFGLNLNLHLTELEKVSKWNRQLRGPSAHSEVRDKLTEAYRKNGYKGLEHTFRKKLGLRYPVRLIKILLQKNVKG